INIAAGEGLGDDSDAIELVAGAGAANAWDLQLATPDIPVVSGNEYEVSFYIRSNQPGKGRISFSGLTNNYPWMDWYGTGSQTEAFETTSQWQQVRFRVSDFSGSTFKMFFDLGYLPGVTYYIDVDNISVVDLDAENEVVNLITNSDFEGGNLDGWNGWGNGSTRAVSAEGAGYGNSGYAMVLTNPTAAQAYEAQQLFTFSQPLEQGTEYTISFFIKANVPANIQFELQSPDYSADYSGGIDVGTTWQQVVRTVSPTAATRDKFVFDFGASAA